MIKETSVILYEALRTDNQYRFIKEVLWKIQKSLQWKNNYEWVLSCSEELGCHP